MSTKAMSEGLSHFRFWILRQRSGQVFDFRLSDKEFINRIQDRPIMYFSLDRKSAIVISLNDLGAFFVQKLMAAIGAEELDLLVPELLIVTIELALTLGAGHPKNFRHSSVPRIFSRKDAKALSLGIKRFQKFRSSFASLRLCGKHLFLVYTFGTRSNTGRGMKSSSRVFSIAAFGTATRAS